jgi:capsular exopolysaccharide synthesis family protein
MSGQQLQPFASETALDQPAYEAVDQIDNGPPQPPAAGPSFARYLSAVNRFKWLVLLLGIIGAGAGYGATKFVSPEYEVKATVLLEQGTGTQGGKTGGGPIQAQELLAASGWKDLLRSYVIADEVVRRLNLYVEPVSPGDSAVLRGFTVDPRRLQPGQYELTLSGNSYTLSVAGGVEREKGTVGDSVGRAVGFLWQPAPDVLRSHPKFGFTVRTPREAAVALITKLDMSLQEGSTFMFLTLTGPNSIRTAATLNAWVEQFVTVATLIKKKNVATYAAILEGQRESAANELTSAENALESFRVRTVTQPSERQTVTPGLDMTNAPVFDNYFRDKTIASDLERDRITLERLLASARTNGGVQREALLSIPAVSMDPAADNLKKLLAEEGDHENKLRLLRQSYTDEFSRVKDEIAAIKVLRETTIPNALAAYVAQIRLREDQIKANVASSERDLRSIPSRTIEEQRLKRQVLVSEDMYKNLDLRAAEAKLAEAATIPDISVLDSAVAPLRPAKNTAPVLILGAIGAALALGIFLAIVLDQVDKRFRYPEQATKDLGLFVLGVVPNFKAKGRFRRADQAAQVVEAFRTIRMNVRYAVDPTRPLTVTITSPGPNDGKSLVSSNLALSFAEAGARTLLIDGDIRRGQLSELFDAPRRPGLVEYLDGTALIAEVLHPTASHPNLTLMPAGARRRRAPELLATPRLQQLINQMGTEYDVVIVDSPPLGAGFDAYALSTATMNMALVLRAGVTDRKMAAARMEVVDTLPVRVLGCVLNGIELKGVFQYYSYYQDYQATDEDAPDALPAGKMPALAVSSESQ